MLQEELGENEITKQSKVGKQAVTPPAMLV